MRHAREGTCKFIILTTSFSTWPNQRVSEGRDSSTMNSIPLGAPFPCLLLCLVTQGIVHRLSSPAYLYSKDIDIRHSPHKSTLFGRFIPARVKGRRVTWIFETLSYKKKCFSIRWTTSIVYEVVEKDPKRPRRT